MKFVRVNFQFVYDYLHLVLPLCNNDQLFPATYPNKLLPLSHRTPTFLEPKPISQTHIRDIPLLLLFQVKSYFLQNCNFKMKTPDTLTSTPFHFHWLSIFAM